VLKIAEYKNELKNRFEYLFAYVYLTFVFFQCIFLCIEKDRGSLSLLIGRFEDKNNLYNT